MNVIAKMQGPHESEPVVDMVWARNTNELGVVQAVAQLLEQTQSSEPWSPTIIEIRIEL